MILHTYNKVKQKEAGMRKREKRKVTVKFALEQAMKAQRANRGIARPFL